MQKHFIYIDQPCTQQWDAMTPQQQGRHCSNCNKTVFDFTAATNNQIVAHLKAMQGKLFCGRFNENQLHTWIEDSGLQKTSPYLYKLMVSAMLLAGGQHVQAQTINKEQTTMQQQLDSVQAANALQAENPAIGCDSVKGVKVVDVAPVIIRLGGARSISSDDTKPLIVVDGKPYPLSKLKKINTDNVSTVTVLKSAEATAIYGPDGVNGAILIQTKKPKKSKGKID